MNIPLRSAALILALALWGGPPASARVASGFLEPGKDGGADGQETVLRPAVEIPFRLVIPFQWAAYKGDFMETGYLNRDLVTEAIRGELSSLHEDFSIDIALDRGVFNNNEGVMTLTPRAGKSPFGAARIEFHEGPSVTGRVVVDRGRLVDGIGGFVGRTFELKGRQLDKLREHLNRGRLIMDRAYGEDFRLKVGLGEKFRLEIGKRLTGEEVPYSVTWWTGETDKCLDGDCAGVGAHRHQELIFHSRGSTRLASYEEPPPPFSEVFAAFVGHLIKSIGFSIGPLRISVGGGISLGGSLNLSKERDGGKGNALVKLSGSLPLFNPDLLSGLGQFAQDFKTPQGGAIVTVGYETVYRSDNMKTAREALEKNEEQYVFSSHVGLKYGEHFFITDDHHRDVVSARAGKAVAAKLAMSGSKPCPKPLLNGCGGPGPREVFYFSEQKSPPFKELVLQFNRVAFVDVQASLTLHKAQVDDKWPSVPYPMNLSPYAPPEGRKNEHSEILSLHFVLWPELLTPPPAPARPEASAETIERVRRAADQAEALGRALDR